MTETLEVFCKLPRTAPGIFLPFCCYTATQITMKALFPFTTNLILAVAIVAVAILSVQNATPVSLQFMIFESINIPVGVVLAFSLAIGLIAGAIGIFIYHQR
ncbi:MAG: LapA family protein [Limnospira sp. PMC 1291.21]|uniref:LapA family protein n=2 Tax=unclassified Limnospira TaxID=2642885 RepID=UPI0028E0C625|nr:MULTISPECIES: LapA family protein [unclassified Limnospira]MDT9176646.1 LapA family protein [Limnospira sp. PMC 1238.20]MDT9227739.1 LapA family protein [Limnospira sp. PMC 1242.20]MDT9302197.1 LapA family protein [Limnospira sp. PMC 1281.21]MDT9304422.1 LapA family protein [Limnospira sp. PMC 1291.21]MDT9324913.1 LapA family protein [Limnospira sp. PMC 1286.21]